MSAKTSRRLAVYKIVESWCFTSLTNWLSSRSLKVCPAICKISNIGTAVPRTHPLVQYSNEKHDEDEKAVRRFAKNLHALVDADEYMTDFKFTSVSWTAPPNPAMPEEDD